MNELRQQSKSNHRPFGVLATPLASIFGSGFLVIIPVLAHAVGVWMGVAMIAVAALAFAVGCVIRFNIVHAEPVLGLSEYRVASSLDRFSDIAIVVAYIISITLYLHILSAFLLTGLGVDSPFNENMVTTGVIVLIVAVGVVRGLDVLNVLEQWALYATLGLVVLVLLGFALYDISALQSSTGLILPSAKIDKGWTALTVVAGTLIVVQGFETPRFLSKSYSTDDRVWGSRMSQIVSSIVYVIFVFLAIPMVHELKGQYDDNSLIALVGFTIIPLISIAVIIAAVLSQFSAAVADTLAGEGNVSEFFNHRVHARATYMFIGIAAIALTWSADTYQVLALASRAFAFYYCLQCLVGALVAKATVQRVAMISLSAIMLFIVIFAVPAS